ncbi:MAG: AraC family transcriptional regulator [Bacteroidia bacterium]|nr:AraC family transcriptional regulator [Bacteroidia bacterium]
MIRYNFERQLIEVFRQNGLDLGLLLNRCSLPEDLFERANVLLTGEEYFRIVEQVGLMASSESVVLSIASAEHVETFIPASFMAYCSDCGLNFLRRFAEYDKLVAPVHINIEETSKEIALTLTAVPESRQLPSVLVEFKMAYWVNLLRNATGRAIKPIKIEHVHSAFSSVIKEYIGCDVIHSDRVTISFMREDLELPFLSRNDSILRYIEPELQRRLSEMEENDDIGMRVRSALTELLPLGKSRIEDVAHKLSMSVRTLQRRLKEAHTNYQQQLGTTRMLQAKAYLQNGSNTSEEIAFLLAYEDTTAFLRAFNKWTGQTVGQFIKGIRG